MTEGKLTAKKQEEEMPRQGDQKGTVRRALWAMWTARKNFGGCKYQQSRKTQAGYTGEERHDTFIEDQTTRVWWRY